MNANSPRIVVLGSLNMDLLVRMGRVPGPGETLFGHEVAHLPGGKGGNQAVACARQGARVEMIGRVGNDANGAALCKALDDDSIDTAGIQLDSKLATGVALVMLEDSGQNRIVVIPGANEAVSVEHDRLLAQLRGAAAFVTQFETPPAQVDSALQAARAAGCPIVLNPSPVRPIPSSHWSLINVLIVNEVEAAEYSGLPVVDANSALVAAQTLRDRGVERVIVTLGEAGAVAVDRESRCHHPAANATVVDTTAAGDTFLGAFVAAHAAGEPFQDAVAHAMRAAAICITRLGAQPSIPTHAEVRTSSFPPPRIPL